MCTTTNLPTLRVKNEMTLPDNDQWHLRFKIHSESSNRVYIVSQNKKGRYWGCSCPAWIIHKHCKHLTAMGIPNDQQPYEVNIIKQ